MNRYEKYCMTEEDDLFLIDMISAEVEYYSFILLVRLWWWARTGNPKIKRIIELCKEGKSLRSAYKEVLRN